MSLTFALGSAEQRVFIRICCGLMVLSSSTGCWSYEGQRLARIKQSQVEIYSTLVEVPDAPTSQNTCPYGDNEWLSLGYLEKRSEPSRLPPDEGAVRRAAKVGGDYVCLSFSARGRDVEKEVSRRPGATGWDIVEYRRVKTYRYGFSIFREFDSIPKSELRRACEIHVAKIAERPSYSTAMSPNPACVELLGLEPPAVEPKVVYEPGEPERHIDGRADAIPAIELLFPLHGVILGQTTVAELEVLGTRENPTVSSGADEYVVINDVKFWHHAQPTATVVSFTRSQPMPESWAARGFDWKLSYDGWLDLMTRLGWTIDEVEAPRVREFQGHPSLSARVRVTSGSLTLKLDFNYSEETSTSAEGTLYSLSVDSYSSPS